MNIDVLGQSMDVERVTTTFDHYFSLEMDVTVTDFTGNEHRGTMERSVSFLLRNAKDDQSIRVSKADLTGDVVADALESAKELVARYPDAYMDDNVPGGFGKYDVIIETASIHEVEQVREVTSDD